MKKLLNFILKILLLLIKFAFMLFVIFIILAYIFSLKNNVSFESAVSTLQAIATEIIYTQPTGNIVPGNNIDSQLPEPSTSSNNNYYYLQLDNNSKIIYDLFENNIDNLIKENFVLDFSTKFNDLLNESTGQYKLNKAFQSALDAFFYDHPELFYIDISKISLNTKCVSIGPLKTYTVQISPKNNSKDYLLSGFNSEQEVQIAINKIEKVKDDIIESTSNLSIYNKIKTVHDFLVNTIEYDTSTNNDNLYNIYGALVENKVVCEGYAKSFKYLMDSLDIECILVTGISESFTGESGAHMWNYIKLNDDWYGVDVTWDDPIIVGGSNNYNLRHDYFLKGSYTFDESHIPSGKITNAGMRFTLPTLSTKNYIW